MFYGIGERLKAQIEELEARHFRSRSKIFRWASKIKGYLPRNEYLVGAIAAALLIYLGGSKIKEQIDYAYAMKFQINGINFKILLFFIF